MTVATANNNRIKATRWRPTLALFSNYDAIFKVMKDTVWCWVITNNCCTRNEYGYLFLWSHRFIAVIIPTRNLIKLFFVTDHHNRIVRSEDEFNSFTLSLFPILKKKHSFAEARQLLVLYHHIAVFASLTYTGSCTVRRYTRRQQNPTRTLRWSMVLIIHSLFNLSRVDISTRKFYIKIFWKIYKGEIGMEGKKKKSNKNGYSYRLSIHFKKNNNKNTQEIRDETRPKIDWWMAVSWYILASP